MSQFTLATIDIGDCREGSLAARKEIARQIDWACREIGFLNIAGHGVPETLVRDMHHVSLAFFDLPLHEKLKSVSRPQPRPLGYHTVGEMGLSYSMDKVTPPDLYEELIVGNIDAPDDDYHRAFARHYGINIWHSKPGALKTVWSGYWQEMERLSHELMRLFALALDADEDFFESKIDKYTGTLKANLYPDQPEPPLPANSEPVPIPTTAV